MSGVNVCYNLQYKTYFHKFQELSTFAMKRLIFSYVNIIFYETLQMYG